MNKHFRNYLNSFKFKKEYWYSLLIDTGFLGIIGLVMFFFGSLIQRKAYLISQGRTAEQLQQMILSMQSEQMQAYLSSLKSFVLVFALGMIIILVGGLFLYSLSRSLIWNRLLEKKFSKKRYWKWNLLNLVLIIPIIVYLLVFGLVRVILGYVVSLFGSQIVLNIFYSLVSLIFLFALVIFVFLVYYSFAGKYKVWESIGEAFRLIKMKWKRIWPVFLLVLGTAIVVSLILWPIGRLLVYQQAVLVGINLAVSLLFIAWMRIYVFKMVK